MLPEAASDDPARNSDGVLFQRSIPADFRWVRRAMHEAEDALVNAGLAAGDVGSIAIVLAETLNNVVEHALADLSEQKITVIIRHRSKSLMVEVRDSGRPMPRGRAPTGAHPMGEGSQFDAMPEGGYGWFLIREIVQDLVYDRQNDENILFFRYRLSG
ncbi:MAG: ATP-binding protein [Silicimonas sp.]|jgi:serine/threonine-protein kinase RsbW|nr:ATP-binding protein [Silicimonas sp.]